MTFSGAYISKGEQMELVRTARTPNKEEQAKIEASGSPVEKAKLQAKQAFGKPAERAIEAFGASNSVTGAVTGEGHKEQAPADSLLFRLIQKGEWATGNIVKKDTAEETAKASKQLDKEKANVPRTDTRLNPTTHRMEFKWRDGQWHAKAEDLRAPVGR